MATKKRWIKVVLPIIILLAGFIGMRGLVSSRSAPQKEIPENPGALVEVMTVDKEPRQIVVAATGVVQAGQEITLVPQVSGRVTRLPANFVAGGFFRQGDILFEIENDDYLLAVEKAQAALAKAEYELATVEGQARVARAEWEELKPADGGAPNPLVLHEPQVKNAQANLLSARASLAQARLDLERTRLVAPFNALVRTKPIDLGQYVRAGSSVGVLVGTDMGEIIVPLPFHETRWLDIPRPGTAERGAPATVRMADGDRQFEWHGRVVRSLGEMDPQGRMLRVAVAVDDPYRLRKNITGDRPDLAVGMFVAVELHGEKLPAVAAVPSRALRDGDTVWLADAEDRLRFRPVTVLRRQREEVLVGDELKEGERIILTNIPGAAEGMKLRPIGDGARP
jgi:RND family efflux transporter MFP subunit